MSYLAGPKDAKLDSYAGRERFDDQGNAWVYAKAHADLTAKTPYRLTWGVNGAQTAALPSGAAYLRVVVPEKNVASGGYAWMKFRGRVNGLVTSSLSLTAGHAVKIHAGAVAATGAAPSGASPEFGVVLTTAASSTAHDVFLFGREILSTA